MAAPHTNFILWSKHVEKQNWNGIGLPFTGLIIIEHKSLSSNLTPNASTAAIHDESPSKGSEKMKKCQHRRCLKTLNKHERGLHGCHYSALPR
jgi:hypothetical protein